MHGARKVRNPQGREVALDVPKPQVPEVIGITHRQVSWLAVISKAPSVAFPYTSYSGSNFFAIRNQKQLTVAGTVVDFHHIPF